MRAQIVAVLEHPLQRQQDLLRRERLLQIIPGAVADGQLGAVRVAETGQDDDLGRVRQVFQPRQHGQPVAVRQTHVQEDHVELLGQGRLNPAGEVRGADRFVPDVSHQLHEGFAGILVVVDHQNLGHHRAPAPACPRPTASMPGRRYFLMATATSRRLTGFFRYSRMPSLAASCSLKLWL